MAHSLPPKKKAQEIYDKFFSRLRGKSMSVKSDVENLGFHLINELIEEHNFGSPVSWNKMRTEYWNAVKIEFHSIVTKAE